MPLCLLLISHDLFGLRHLFIYFICNITMATFYMYIKLKLNKIKHLNLIVLKMGVFCCFADNLALIFSHCVTLQNCYATVISSLNWSAYCFKNSLLKWYSKKRRGSLMLQISFMRSFIMILSQFLDVVLNESKSSLRSDTGGKLFQFCLRA